MEMSQTIAIIDIPHFFGVGITHLSSKRCMHISLDAAACAPSQFRNVKLILVSYSIKALCFFERNSALFESNKIIFIVNFLHIPTVRLLHSFGFFSIMKSGASLKAYSHLLNTEGSKAEISGCHKINVNRRVKLTKMERKVALKLLSQYSMKECAHHFNIAEKTISTHKNNITTKLGLSNFLHLLVNNPSKHLF